MENLLNLYGLKDTDFDWYRVADYQSVIDTGLNQASSGYMLNNLVIMTTLINPSDLNEEAASVGLIYDENHLPVKASGEYFLKHPEKTLCTRLYEGFVYMGVRNDT